MNSRLKAVDADDGQTRLRLAGLLDDAKVSDFLVRRCRDFGLEFTDFATTVNPTPFECYICESAQEEEATVPVECLSSTLLCDLEDSKKRLCLVCGGDYLAGTKSLGNGGIKGLCRECYHLRYIACFQCCKRQAHPSSFGMTWRLEASVAYRLLDVARLACATCKPPIRAEPPARESDFKAASGVKGGFSASSAIAPVDEPNPKRVRRVVNANSETDSDSDDDALGCTGASEPVQAGKLFACSGCMSTGKTATCSLYIKSRIPLEKAA